MININASLMQAAIQQSQEREEILRHEVQDLNERYLKEVKKLRALKLVGQALGDIDEDPVRAFDIFSEASKMPRGRLQKKIMEVFLRMNRPLTVADLAYILDRSSPSLSTCLKTLCKRGHLTKISRGLYVR